MRIAYALTLLLIWGTSVLANDHPATAPTTAPSADKMNYTLGNDNNENLAKNPTADQIKAAVASLDGDKVNAVYIHKDETHAIQVNWEADTSSFSFIYIDGGDAHMYASKKKYPPDVAVTLLLSYMSGKDDWLKMVDWAPMK